nr:recombinase family protein [uncultured Desulfobacter sp.]
MVGGAYQDHTSRAGGLVPLIMLIGYARVSSVDQNLELQTDALKKAGCAKIFSDKISGMGKKKPGLENALSHLRTGDTFVIW